jgi:hypothetical protein
VISELEALRIESVDYTSIGNSITEMLKWLSKYQDEAVESEAIVLATILNPRFRGKFFSIHYPEQDTFANSTIETAFNIQMETTEEAELSQTPEDDTIPTDTEPDEFDVFGAPASGATKASSSELQDYLDGKYPMKKDQTPLGWWKVRFFFFLLVFFELLLMLALYRNININSPS